MKIKLGDKVKDTVCGLVGMAVARTEFIEGCKRITIQPKVNKDGTVPDSITVDEPLVEVITPKKRKKETETGGPMMKGGKFNYGK